MDTPPLLHPKGSSFSPPPCTPAICPQDCQAHGAQVWALAWNGAGESWVLPFTTPSAPWPWPEHQGLQLWLPTHSGRKLVWDWAGPGKSLVSREVGV